MFTNRFLLVISILSLLLVSLAVANPFTHDPEPVDTSWPPRPDYSHLSEKPMALAPVDLVEAYRLYHQSEWASVPIPAVDLTAYYESERTLIDPNAGLEIYQLSERTLIDPQAGMTIYQQSERTSIPIRFNKYQLSEWFGK
jgi:hypothetical protein